MDIVEWKDQNKNWQHVFTLRVFAAPPMGNAPHFSTDVTDTSIVISWTPVPHIGYKVHSLQTHNIFPFCPSQQLDCVPALICTSFRMLWKVHSCYSWFSFGPMELDNSGTTDLRDAVHLIGQNMSHQRWEFSAGFHVLGKTLTSDLYLLYPRSLSLPDSVCIHLFSWQYDPVRAEKPPETWPLTRGVFTFPAWLRGWSTPTASSQW